MANLDVNLALLQVQVNMHHLLEMERARLQHEADQQLVVRRRRVRRRRYYCRPANTPLQRLLHGDWSNLLRTLRTHDEGAFYNYMRMPPRMFDEILHRVTPYIMKKQTNFKDPLEPGLKLACVLRHLATGDSYPTMAFGYRISRHTVAAFLPEVCQAIFDSYADEVLESPDSQEDWLEVEEAFRTRWNLPHCCGAIDGKHIAIRKPNKSGTLYHNYKGFFSVVLLAVVDADYKILWADVGGVGHQSDAQIFNASDLSRCLQYNTLNLPEDEPLPGDDRPFPYFFVGDDAFALRPRMMKPWGSRNLDRAYRIANYRLSRARRVSENAFGILANRWRCLLGTMMQGPQVVQVIIKALCCLHNVMRIRYPTVNNNLVDQEDDQHYLVPGEWRRDVQQLLPLNHALPRGQYDLKAGSENRKYLTAYINSPAGSVPWQERMVV